MANDQEAGMGVLDELLSSKKEADFNFFIGTYRTSQAISQVSSKAQAQAQEQSQEQSQEEEAVSDGIERNTVRLCVLSKTKIGLDMCRHTVHLYTYTVQIPLTISSCA